MCSKFNGKFMFQSILLQIKFKSICKNIRLKNSTFKKHDNVIRKIKRCVTKKVIAQNLAIKAIKLPIYPQFSRPLDRIIELNSS